ncbi:MAG: hypothetical protein Q4P08_06245 [Eubacteriales bacterium]|nr:hypothetical protein [Eubacteriales bacterium]
MAKEHGISDKGHIYGTEYGSVHQHEDIKFVKYNFSSNAKAPLETMTKGRIYATLDAKNNVKYITFYDRNNMKFKQIDVSGKPHYIDEKKVLPHVHVGYIHDEHDTRTLNRQEQKTVDRVLKIWNAINDR